MSTVLLILCNEVYKRSILFWDYKFNAFMQVLTIALIFIGASYLLGNGSFNTGTLSSLFLGYMVWLYARLMITSFSIELLGEAQSGTLEQMYMSPVQPEVVLLGRILATLITATLCILLLCLCLVPVLKIPIPLRWEALPVFFLILIGLFGLSLLLSGASLLFKQIDTFADLLQNALLFLTGTLLPVSRFPTWLATIAQALPTTQGIIVLRAILLHGESLTVSWRNGSLIWLLIHSLLFLGIGWFIFKRCEYVARSRGLLGQY